MLDILILCAKKDLNKLPYVINSTKENISDINNIFVVTPDLNIEKIEGVNYVSDDDACNFDSELKDKWNKFIESKIFWKPKWIFQQFVKLTQTLTLNKYLIIDCDIIINKKIDLFNNNKPFFFLGTDQNFYKYSNFNKKLIGLDRVYNHSFISEMMIMDRVYLQDMYDRFFNGTSKEFLLRCLDVIDDEHFISEYELYGNYMMKYHIDAYDVKKLNNHVLGKQEEWRDDEIKNVLSHFKNTNIDIFTIHSWM